MAEFYFNHGTGLFGQYLAFRWLNNGSKGILKGVDSPDPITFDKIVGYEEERKIIIENTENLILGLPVKELSKQAGLDIPDEQLKTLAIQWEMRYNGRSGRTARQFVDWLIGEKQRHPDFF